ncbi:MAG: sucrose-6-phosphate hydrolase [Lachnospiraceae bacterium]|nr:sucrose-6-phosphate hydrolase [Lachnospiraceae bacterium]
MKEWTKEERYRPLNSLDEIRELEEKIKTSPFRQGFHVQPRTGLLNDPNGFIYDDETKTWHLFYQWFPWGATHGLKYWYHMTSKNLVNWEDAGIGIKPDTDMDNKGAYSGSAIKCNGEIYIYYTGNHRDENWVRTAYTCLAKLKSDNSVEKFEKPLFGPEEDYSEHQRDPKIWYDEKLGKYFIIIGARSKDDRGCLLVYESEDATQGWKLKGELNVKGYEAFGKMWECPSIEKIGDSYVFIFCPQFIKLPGRGEVTNHNLYVIGDLDMEKMTFTPTGDFKHLDLGFEVYAAACAANTEKTFDYKVLSAWMGLPDAVYYTDDEDWSGCLTLPRELHIKDGKLLQKPIRNIFDAKKEMLYSEGNAGDNGSTENSGDAGSVASAGKYYEIKAPSVWELATENDDFNMEIFCDADGNGGISLSYDASSSCLKISRAKLKRKINPEYGEEREVIFENAISKLTCFFDNSSIEIFFNDGEEVFTSRIFPDRENGEKYLKLEGIKKFLAYGL